MYKRTLEPILVSLAKQYPVLTITGPRQSGKTTLCREAFPRKAYVNLENPDTRRLATEDPRGFLANIPDGAILDEIQRAPQLASYLQEVVDGERRNGLFILTGSQQFEVMTRISQSLAGRTAVLKLLPLSLEELPRELKTGSIDRLMLAGLYPRLHKEKLEPARFYGDYMETCIERDLRQLVAVKDLNVFERFVRLCAGRVGGLLNLHSLGNDAGVSHTTARAWITLLQAGYIIFSWSRTTPASASVWSKRPSFISTIPGWPAASSGLRTKSNSPEIRSAAACSRISWWPRRSNTASIGGSAANWRSTGITSATRWIFYMATEGTPCR